MHDESFSLDCLTPRSRRTIARESTLTLERIEELAAKDEQRDGAEPFAEAPAVQFSRLRAFNEKMRKFWEGRL
jgi:hypothetical protein